MQGFSFKQLYWFKNSSELSDVSLLLLAVAGHAGALEEIAALPIVEGFPHFVLLKGRQ